MITIHWSTLAGLMCASAIIGFFTLAFYITHREKCPTDTTITEQEQEELEEQSKKMAETLKRQAEPEAAKPSVAAEIMAEEEKANRAMQHLLSVLKGEQRSVAIIKSDRFVFPHRPEGRC